MNLEDSEYRFQRATVQGKRVAENIEDFEYMIQPSNWKQVHDMIRAHSGVPLMLGAAPARPWIQHSFIQVRGLLVGR